MVYYYKANFNRQVPISINVYGCQSVSCTIMISSTDCLNISDCVGTYTFIELRCTQGQLLQVQQVNLWRVKHVPTICNNQHPFDKETCRFKRATDEWRTDYMRVRCNTQSSCSEVFKNDNIDKCRTWPYKTNVTMILILYDCLQGMY